MTKQNVLFVIVRQTPKWKSEGTRLQTDSRTYWAYLTMVDEQ